VRFSIGLNAVIVVALAACVIYSVMLYTPVVPIESFAGPAALLLFYVAVRVIVFARQSRAEPGKRGAGAETYGYISLNPLIIWLGNAAFAWIAFVSLPYASEPLRLMSVAFFIGATAIDMLLTVRAPPDNGIGPVGLLLVPLAVGYVLLTEDGEYGFALGLFYLFFAGMMFALNRTIQRLVNQAHASRLAAEAAAADILHERDLRSRFFASATHDLGQPLQSARLFLDQATRATDPEQRAAAAGHAKNALGSMERLLRQMLDHLRLDAGAMKPELRIVVAGDVMGAIASQFDPAVALAGIRLIAMPSRQTVRADPALLERALSNLVDNAIRHSEARRILVGVRRAGQRLRFLVVDDGCGVADADIPSLFDEFAQGQSYGGKERGGFGLGLASVRRMAALMGGQAGMAVNKTRGSAFFLDLPGASPLA
jgi:signal transduction histidine kinase